MHTYVGTDCCCAALLGLSLELLSGSLIAPSGQDLQPTDAAKQWADAPVNQDVPAQAWAAVGLSVDALVRLPFQAFIMDQTSRGGPQY